MNFLDQLTDLAKMVSMNMETPKDWYESIRDAFGDVDEFLPRSGVGRRLTDAAADKFMRQGMRLLERFVGDREPRTAKDRKKRRILEAATKLFIEQGYRKTSMDEVAREAGVAKGTVYLYFKTKADLLVHAIGLEKLRYVGDVMEILSADVHPRERLREYLRAAFVLVVQMPLVSRLMTGDRELLVALEDYGMAGGFSPVDIQSAFMAFLVRRAAPDARWSSEEIEDRARVLLGLMYASGFIDDERLRGGMSEERFAGLLADMLVDGIAAPPGSTKGGDR